MGNVSHYSCLQFRPDRVVQTAVVFDGDDPHRGAEIPDELRKAARASILHCQSLVENVQDINKFKAGKMVLATNDFSLRDVCKEVNLTMRHAFPAVPQTVECAHAYHVRGSRRHLKQVLQNLISNACKNTRPSGFVELEVELLARTKPGHSAYRFAVRDTGCGVPRHEQARHVENSFSHAVVWYFEMLIVACRLAIPLQDISQIRPGRRQEGHWYGPASGKRICRPHGRTPACDLPVAPRR